MSGGFNPISMVSQIALGVMTGGASLIEQLAMQIVSQIAKQVIQEVGQELGLPKPAIDAALGAFDAASGNIGGAAAGVQGAVSGAAHALNLTPQAQGNLQRTADTTAQDWKTAMINNNVQNGQDGEGNAAGRSSGRGGSWLKAIAEVIGKRLDSAAAKIKSDSDSLNWESPKASSDFQAETQEFNLLMNTLTNAIKTMGEALTTAARKS